jgi:hypothetical protein
MALLVVLSIVAPAPVQYNFRNSPAFNTSPAYKFLTRAFCFSRLLAADIRHRGA